MNRFGFFFSLPMFTNRYCICTLSTRTAWKESEKRKHGNWGVRQSVPFLLLIIVIIILFFFKYHHWRNPMHDTVPKPTPNCFAVHLYQQVFTPASSERASEGYKSMICTSPSVYLCDVFSRSGSFSISALWFMLILAISPPSLPSEPV